MAATSLILTKAFLGLKNQYILWRHHKYLLKSDIWLNFELFKVSYVRSNTIWSFDFGHLPFWSQLDVLGVSSHLNWKSYRVDFRFFQNFIFGVKLNYRKFEFQIRPYVYIADGVATWASFFLIRFVMLTFDNGIKLRNRITVQSPLFVIFHPFEVILTSFRRFFFENIQFLDFFRVDISAVFIESRAILRYFDIF